MKIYGKKSLQLKEKRFKKSEVVLKEDDNVHVTDLNKMADKLTKQGEADVSNDGNRQVLDVPFYTTQNKITPTDLQNAPQVTDALKLVKSNPKYEVELTANKVNGTVTPLKTTNTTSQTGLAESVVFTKNELNNFLRNL